MLKHGPPRCGTIFYLVVFHWQFLCVLVSSRLPDFYLSPGLSLGARMVNGITARPDPCSACESAALTSLLSPRPTLTLYAPFGSGRMRE